MIENIIVAPEQVEEPINSSNTRHHTSGGRIAVAHETAVADLSDTLGMMRTRTEPGRLVRIQVLDDVALG